MQTRREVSRNEFHRYLKLLDLQNKYPAIVSVNYATRVRSVDLAEFVARQNSEERVTGETDTYPSAFKIYPFVPRPEYLVQSLVYPSQWQKLAGFDLMSRPPGDILLLEEARDTGALVASSIALKRSTERPSADRTKLDKSMKGVVVSVRMPVYEPKAPVGTLSERRAAYIGSVGIHINIDSLVENVLNKTSLHAAHLRLTIAATTGTAEQLIFDNARNVNSAASTDGGVFRVLLPIDYNGREWSALFEVPKSTMDTDVTRWMGPIAALFSFILSMLICALLFMQLSERIRALTLARIMARKASGSRRKLKATNRKLSRLTAHTIDIKEEERKRIAREIHDDLGQTMLSLRLDIDTLAAGADSLQVSHLQGTRGKITAAINSIRQIINNLRPTVLELGLNAAIEWQLEEFESKTGISCTFSDGNYHVEVDDVSSTAFFRILQETLTNISRHAQATLVKVDLRQDDEHLYMTVTDDGVGLKPDQRNKVGSFGLIGIEERIAILGGTFRVTGSPDGTVIHVSVPMNYDFDESNNTSLPQSI